MSISGGRVNHLYGYVDSSITFYGYDFMAMDGLTLVDGYVLGTGRLAGKWFNGTYFSTDILENRGTIMVIPAPGAFLLGTLGLSFAGWKLQKRKKQ